MIGSSLVWRMALRNLGRQWKQSLLTILAGSIGGMLIAVSVVNYDSVQISGEQWMEQRLGSIYWKLKPKLSEGGSFTPSEIEVLSKAGNQYNNIYNLLPYVATEAVMAKAGDEARGQAVLKSLLLLGFPMEAAAKLDKDRAALWQRELQPDELIVTSALGKLLHASVGDVVSVTTSKGDRLFRIRDIVEERGLTGFRESGHTYTGTIIASEQTVRELAGNGTGEYPAILAGPDNPDINMRSIFRSDKVDFDVEYLKADSESKIRKMNFALIMGLISSVAIVSSLLFMRQVLVIIGESRRELYGILRAIGLSRGHIGGIFLTESLLLSLFSALLGTVAGLVAGYVLVKLLFGMYAEELARMAGTAIPIHPHISMSSIIIVFGGILFFLVVVSAVAARHASSVRITDALRGAVANEGNEGKRKRSFGGKLLLGVGLICSTIHFMLAFAYPPNLNSPNSGGTLLMIGLTWIIACFTVLYLFANLLGRSEKLLTGIFSRLGVPPVSIILAVKYPGRNAGRTYTTGMLFALVMMTITFVVNMLGMVQATNDVERNNQTIFGFGAHASYMSVEERERIAAAAEEDPFIREHVKGSMYAEPYMLLLHQNGHAKAIVPVTEQLLQPGGVELLQRAPEFASDKEAWEAVMNDPRYIIMPHEFMYDTDVPEAGETITLSIYEDKLVLRGEVRLPVEKNEYIIAGFVRDEVRFLLIDFYGAIFTNPTVAEHYRSWGTKWQNQQALGFMLFMLDYKDIKLAQELEDRFAVNGVMTFTVPYMNNSATQLVNQQIGNGFIGAAVFSAIIGLMGLAVIQFRAVRDRSPQVAMMRCIGMPNKQIYGIFLIEGFVISMIGLLAGWAVGSSGAHLFLEAINADLQAHEEKLLVPYPFGILLPILGGLLLASLILNMAPARAALRLKAADALRRGNE